MSQRGRQVYEVTQRETSVAIASPAELVVMAYSRMMEHLRLAIEGLQRGDDVAEPVGKALDLITDGLQSCLDRERGGEVAANLDTLYNWACAEILRGRLRRDPQCLQNVINVLAPVAQAWEFQAQGGPKMPDLAAALA
jgi:flagellar protein FliS